MDRLIDRLDRLQRRWRPTAFIFAVQKKYSDDRGGYLAALVTYYGFISVFPLLLAAFTIVAYALAGHPETVRSLERHIGSYPIIGTAAADLEGRTLHGSPLALIVGVGGLVWGAMGLSQAMQHTMGQAWNVAEKDRPGFGPRLLRGIGWYCIFGVGVVASTFVASLGTALGLPGGLVLSEVEALVINLLLFSASFWILSPPAPLPKLLPGACFAGFVWTVLTGVGIGLTHHLAHSNALYGTFAPVLGLLALLYLAARLSIYAVEANVVAADRLWPRSLSGRDLTAADRRQLACLAERQRRVEGQRVSVEL
jgi:uncharacterized BrkB/YihY/UPF0761 family membrane protein